MNLIYILLFILIIFYLLLEIKYFNPKSKCWIKNNLFPEATEIFNYKHIILDELIKILDNNNWSIWATNDYNQTPIFTNMNDVDIIHRLQKNSGKINSNKNPSWRLFGLILNKKILPNAQYCPNTIKILNKYSDKILNAGFSLLEPGCLIGLHKDYNNKFYRLHIPLIIPKNNNKLLNSFIPIEKSTDKLAVLQVENDYKVWKDDEYFIFDDTCQHNAWNNTNENRIVLIIDLLHNNITL
jgi:aspartyl/asparaginyl beta-hydroxylase (cupin superfamily)